MKDPDADSYHSEDFGLVDNSDLFDMADDVHNPVNVLESKPVQPTAHPPTRETSTASIYSPVTQKGTSLLNEKGGPLQNVLRGTRSRSHSSTDVSSTSKNGCILTFSFCLLLLAFFRFFVLVDFVFIWSNRIILPFFFIRL